MIVKRKLFASLNENREEKKDNSKRNAAIIGGIGVAGTLGAAIGKGNSAASRAKITATDSARDLYNKTKLELSNKANELTRNTEKSIKEVKDKARERIDSINHRFHKKKSHLEHISDLEKSDLRRKLNEHQFHFGKDSLDFRNPNLSEDAINNAHKIAGKKSQVDKNYLKRRTKIGRLDNTADKGIEKIENIRDSKIKKLNREHAANISAIEKAEKKAKQVFEDNVSKQSLDRVGKKAFKSKALRVGGIGLAATGLAAGGTYLATKKRKN